MIKIALARKWFKEDKEKVQFTEKFWILKVHEAIASCTFKIQNFSVNWTFSLSSLNHFRAKAIFIIYLYVQSCYFFIKIECN